MLGTERSLVIRRRTAWLITLIVLATLIVGGVAALAFLPELARKTAIWRLEALTLRRVTIDRVEVNAFTGRVAVHGLRVAEREGPGVLAKVDRIEARIHRRSLLRLHVWIENLTITGTEIRLVRLASGRFTIADLLDRPARTGGGVEVTIDRLRVADSAFFFEDRTLSPARTWTVARIEIDGRGLSTTNAGGSLELRSVIAGAPLLVRADELRLVPYHVRAQITAANVDLGLLRLYLPGDAAVLPERGLLAAGITIVHDVREGIRVSAGARVRGLALGRRGQEGVFALSPEITIALNDLVIKGDAFTLARAEVEGDVGVVEAFYDPPLLYDFTKTRLVVEDLAWPARRPGRVAFTGGLPGGGGLEVRGTVAGDPPAADLAVRALRLPVDLANRYARLAGTLGGVVDLDLRVTASLRDQRPRLGVSGALGAARLAVADPARPEEPPLAVERLDASRIEYEHPGRLTIGFLNLRAPRAHLERDAAGALTLASLFTRREAGRTAMTPEEGTATPGLEVSIGELRLRDGALTLVDGTLTPAPRFGVSGLGLVVTNAAWPARGPAHIALDATLAGGGVVRVTGSGELDRRTARLTATASDLDVAQAQPYLPFRGRVQGRVDAELDVRGQLEPFLARVRGKVGARDVALLEGDRPLLTLARVDVTGIDFQAPARVQIDDVHVLRPFALLERDAGGELSLRAALAARPPSTPAAGLPKPDVLVRRALVEDGGASIVDASVEPAARFRIRGTRLEVQNLTWPVRGPAEVLLATPLPRGGRLEGRGTFQLDPSRMDLRVTVADAALALAQPYLPVAAHLTGKVDGEARISGTFEPFTLSVRGGAAVKDLAVGDAHRELLTAGRARAEGVDVQWPGGVRVTRVEIERPWVLVERDESDRFPLLDLLRPRAARVAPLPAPAGDAGPGKATEPLSLEVGTFALTDGFGRFVDRTTDPDFAEEISALNLTVEGLGTTPESKARTTLRATLGPGTPLAIDGRLGTLGAPLSLDVLFTLGGYAVPRANAYLDTFFGWTARRGRLTLAVRYRVEGDDLQASNGIKIAGLDVVRSAPRARPPKWPLGLPLDTFVALLKDVHGNIDFSLPVHGRLSSPDFEMSDAVWSALRGLAIKTIALPFTLVGRLFFTEDSRIEALSVNPVTFGAGVTTPAPGMAEHLDRLGTFLQSKPAIRLHLRPVLTVADVEPLKRAALREQLQRRAKDDGDAALREQALRLFTRRYPKRAAPAGLDELLAVLATEGRAPAAAEAALGASRVQAVRDALGARGIDLARLVAPGTAPAVETEGTGRVEFEITQ